MSRNLLVSIVFALSVSACSRDSAPIEPPLLPGLASPTVARVNGLAVPYTALEIWAAESRLDLAVPEQRERALDSLIDALVLAQRAESEGLMLDPKVRTRAALARVQSMGSVVLSATAMQPVDESELRAEYASQLARLGTGRFQIDEWVFETEAAALDFAGRLLGDAKDADASGASKQRSGEWVGGDQLPASVREALLALGDGELRMVPVHSEQGWHVLRRVAAELPAAPAFEQVRDALQRSLAGRRAQEIMRALRAKAEVEKLEVPT